MDFEENQVDISTLHGEVERRDLGDVEAHYEVEGEDVFVAANVDTPVYQNLILQKNTSTQQDQTELKRLASSHPDS